MTDNEMSDIAARAEKFNMNEEKTMWRNISGIIQNWFNTESKIKWRFRTYESGTFKAELRTVTKKYSPWTGGHKVCLKCAGNSISSILTADVKPDSANAGYFSETGSFVGKFEIPAPATYEVELSAIEINTADPAGLSVSGLVLRKIQAVE